MKNYGLTLTLLIGLALWIPDIWAETIVMEANKHFDATEEFKSRSYGGKASWGIRGSKVVESGTMTGEFPGPSGIYKVHFMVLLEGDGQPGYKVSAGNDVLGQGKYPWPKNNGCSDVRVQDHTIELGTHQINQGDDIEVWGKSTYECNKNRGAYTLWYELRFISQGQPTPNLSVDPNSLSFSYKIGDPAPESKNVAVSISEGSISGLMASSGADWLNTTVSGNKIVNTLVPGKVTIGEHTTQVAVSANGAGATSYSVTVQASEDPVYTTLKISPSLAYVEPGESTQFTAEAIDQNGFTMPTQPTLNWSVENGGEITQNGIFTAGSSEGGPWKVKVEAEGKQAQAEVIVAVAPPVHLRINAGGGETGNWMADSYSSGGTSHTFGGTHDVGGVENPAPNEVYQTVNHQGPTYNIPASDVPDGNYQVRLHFTDAAGSEGQRKMNVSIEGEQVLSNYDIVAQAGGKSQVDIQEFIISVDDNNGMTIVFDAGSGNDAFVAGLEIMSTKTLSMRVPNNAVRSEATEEMRFVRSAENRVEFQSNEPGQFTVWNLFGKELYKGATLPNGMGSFSVTHNGVIVIVVESVGGNSIRHLLPPAW